jgi:hypothetical protein
MGRELLSILHFHQIEFNTRRKKRWLIIMRRPGHEYSWTFLPPSLLGEGWLTTAFLFCTL